MRNAARRCSSPRQPGSGVTRRTAEKHRLEAETARKQRDEEAIKFAKICLEGYIRWLNGGRDAELTELAPERLASQLRDWVTDRMPPKPPARLPDGYLVPPTDEENRYRALKCIQEVLLPVRFGSREQLELARDLVENQTDEELAPVLRNFAIKFLNGLQDARDKSVCQGPGRPRSTVARNIVIAEAVEFIVQVHGLTKSQACRAVKKALQQLGRYLETTTIQEVYDNSPHAEFVRRVLNNVRIALSVDTFSDEQKVWIWWYLFGRYNGHEKRRWLPCGDRDHFRIDHFD
jgi:hypothetical protein